MCVWYFLNVAICQRSVPFWLCFALKCRIYTTLHPVAFMPSAAHLVLHFCHLWLSLPFAVAIVSLATSYISTARCVLPLFLPVAIDAVLHHSPNCSAIIQFLQKHIVNRSGITTCTESAAFSAAFRAVLEQTCLLFGWCLGLLCQMEATVSAAEILQVSLSQCASPFF